VLPVASLWASLDYKSVANLPIRVSQILYVILLISEINERTFLSRLYLGKEISYDTRLKMVYHRKKSFMRLIQMYKKPLISVLIKMNVSPSLFKTDSGAVLKKPFTIVINSEQL